MSSIDQNTGRRSDSALIAEQVASSQTLRSHNWPAGKYGLENICIMAHNLLVSWTVELADEFEPEYENLPNEAQDELLAMTRLLQRFGPQLKRPHADTMNGSRHANMKELRFHAANGIWRVAFAFDPHRKAVLLVAGDKSGHSEKRFYRGLIKKADERYDAHLCRLAKKERK